MPWWSAVEGVGLEITRQTRQAQVERVEAVECIRPHRFRCRGPFLSWLEWVEKVESQVRELAEVDCREERHNSRQSRPVAVGEEGVRAEPLTATRVALELASTASVALQGVMGGARVISGMLTTLDRLGAPPL